MKPGRIFIVFLAFVLLFLALVPAPVQVDAASTTVKWKVVNGTKVKVPILLFGPATYNLVALPKKTTTFPVLPGKYTYVMTVCGARLSGTLEIQKFAKAFKIGDCAEIKVMNWSYQPVYMTLKGPFKYNFLITEKKTILTILPGKYTYSYTSCAKNTTGSFMVKKARKYIWHIHHCP